MNTRQLLLCLSIVLTAVAAIPAAVSRRFSKETLQGLTFTNTKSLARFLAQVHPPKKGRKALNKYARLAQALKTIRRARTKKTKKLTKKKHHRSRRHLADTVVVTNTTNTTDTYESFMNAPTPVNPTVAESNIFTNGIFDGASNFIYNNAESLGRFTGFIPSKIGFDYNENLDYVSTGLGTIGFSYGLYDYLSRKNDFKKISSILTQRYKMNGLHNAAMEQENMNLAYINKQLVYCKAKLERTKRAIENRVHEFDNPLFK